MLEINEAQWWIAFSNAFWIFIGILVGTVVQYLMQRTLMWHQRQNAKKLFRIEIEINQGELDRLGVDIENKLRLFASGEQLDHDFYFDMSAFNYRMLDPLINSGHFHEILGLHGVKSYFKFANDCNEANARVLQSELRRQAELGGAVRYLQWIRDAKFKEWRAHLDSVKEITQSK